MCRLRCPSKPNPSFRRKPESRATVTEPEMLDIGFRRYDARRQKKLIGK